MPIFQSQNNFNSRNKKNSPNEPIKIIVDISKIKKKRTITKGNNINPRVLSNKKEKKIANLARSLTLNKCPKSFISINLLRKKNTTLRNTKPIADKLITV